MKERLVLIGNGMAGIRTIEEVLKLEMEKFDITVFGAEPHPNYNRILLSPVLADEQNFDDIILNDLAWYEDNNITLHMGDAVTKIDRKQRILTSESGLETPYDRLLISTGSNPFIIPVPGHDLEGVIGFRDINDVDIMLKASKNHKNAVVIGGGLLGLEAANGLIKQDMHVTVIHILDSLMERQLDTPASALLQGSLEAAGMSFKMAAQTTKITGDGKVEAIHFADGTSLETSLVVMAVGIRPNISLAQDAGIHCERGIVVNDTMQTYDPRVYSVGECVQHRGNVYGLVAPLFEQAKVCANQLIGLGYSFYQGSVTSTKLKVTGIDLFSAGNYLGSDDTEDLLLQDPHSGIYKKIVIKDDIVQGAVLYGDTTDGAWYFQLMKDQTNIADIRSKLLFGQHNLGDSGHGGESMAASMANDAQVCDCNGVSKGDIIAAISSQGLFTLNEVKKCTKAGASCGSCVGLVEQILESTVGGDYQSAGEPPICGCTDYSHQQVKDAIKANELKSNTEVYDYLEWRNTDGCAACRPAVNYYILSSFPGDGFDDPQSRFINERAHGNIQKDGTFSVIPRMWGGRTNPHELRTIADAAEKFNAGEVHLTGGQRINMLGIKKEDLPAMWEFLSERGMVSGHAYGKAMRTCKTCVGSEWCRFGTQDSTALGIKLEELTWGSWMPHKFKLAVSGCPRNCAEATIKDFGVVCIDSGYELHIAGNGGIKLRGTDVLCRVTTEEEVIEYCAAFTQLYREEGYYLERTAPWVERVSLTHVKEQIVNNADNRTILAARFAAAQATSQDDPWKQRAEGKQAHEFSPINLLEASS